jgi:hypothetical protein
MPCRFQFLDLGYLDPVDQSSVMTLPDVRSQSMAGTS